MSPPASRAARAASSFLAGLICTAALFMLAFWNLGFAPPELESRPRGVRIADAAQREDPTPQRPVKAMSAPKVPKMRITPEVAAPVNTPPLPVQFMVNPNIAVGVAVATPPSVALPQVESAVFTQGELDSQPSLTCSPRPEYPARAKHAGKEGTVLVRLTLDVDGRVTQSAVIGGNGAELFGEATLKAVERWRFKPGGKGGRPVPCLVEIPVVFSLHK